jgi:iron complex outermembrane receptor protein
MTKKTLTALCLSLAAGSLLAESFDLGQISVAAPETSAGLFETQISSETIDEHSSENLAEAVDNISGVYIGNMGGRNETTVSIRGFDARRVAVFADGVPIYVPYDGNFDYGRFLTADIGEITVSKGFSSVLYGANTFAGVINIVSKKPVAPLESDLRTTLVLDSEGKMARYMGAFNLGTRQEHVYAQLGASYAKQDHFRLSDDFDVTAEQPAGDRLRSKSEDQKVSFKLGYVADDESEVALSYANQQASKQQPPVTDTSYSRTKYWDWPMWDKESVSFNGQKNFDGAYLKGNFYYDSYKNALYAYDDANYSTMNKKYAFKSEYDDYSAGGRLEYGMELDEHRLKTAANYKKDVHRGYDIDTTTGDSTLTEEYHDNIYSLGIEGIYQATSSLSVIAGIGYDYLDPGKFYDTNKDQNITGGETQSAFNPQIALIYHFENAGNLRASVARKTHLPTMKERYSRKLGQAVANSDLGEERATHYELAYQVAKAGLSLSASLYYSRIEDAIQSVYYGKDADGDELEQNQNVGDFGHTGVELDLGYLLGDLQSGLNYAYIDIENLDDGDEKMIRIPEHELFLYADYALTGAFSLYANMRYRDGVYSQDGKGNYLKVPSFTTFDIKASYAMENGFTAEAGVKNLLDEDYAYDLGFPEPGREFFVTLAYRY